MVWAGENGLKREENSKSFYFKTPCFVELCRYCVLHFEGLWQPLSKSVFTILQQHFLTLHVSL